nr:PREDICTED: uncharacterized protein LOC105671592 [Linepithema humile]
MIDNAKIVFSPSNVSTNVLTETEIESFTMEDNFRLDENAIINNEVIPNCNVQRDPDSDNIDRQQCKCCPQHKQNAIDKYLKEILRQQHLFKAHLWQMNDDMRNLQTSFNETVRGHDLEQLLNNYLLIESNFKSTRSRDSHQTYRTKWAKFESHHELIRASYKDRFNESEYVSSNFFDNAEITYVQQRSQLVECAERLKEHSATSNPPQENRNERHPQTALPRIKLQTFSGAYEDWPTFRDLFQSVIGRNSSISDIERFHYLRSCLQGAAERLIRPLSVTENNYTRAWTMLENHFENKRELIRSNFAAFTTVAKMKSDTADELSRIYHAVTTAVNAQESIDRPIESHGMDLFNHLVVELFDLRTRLEWESSICDFTNPPEHETLLTFISKRITTLNAARPKGTTVKASTDSSRSARSLVTKHRLETSRCVVCKENHSIRQCSEFKAKSPTERKTVIDTNRLCYNCLNNHLVTKCQSSKNCFTCKARHHTMLHEAYVPAQSAEVSALSATRTSKDRKATLLATARVIITDRFGDSHAVRVLIDQGSEVSIIFEALAQRLRLSRSRSEISIVGIGGTRIGSTRGKVTLNLTSRVTGVHLSAVAFVLPRLSLYQGVTMGNCQNWPHIADLPLADPQFQANDPIELLLGAEICSIILEEGLRKGGPQTPIAQKTSLGWILSGGCSVASSQGQSCSLQCSADQDLHELLRRFWEQERETSAPTALTPEEEKCEEIFSSTHTRTNKGRYVVRLPFASTPQTLAGTRKPAERLLAVMEAKCKRDPRFGGLYQAFMQEYEDLRHMERIDTPPENERRACYLPHHGVFRESSTTTKLRVVFNGSQRTGCGESLNAHFFAGANLLPTLADVILRWRLHRYAMITDIEKMYRQIIVHPDDRDWQRILWRHDTRDNVQEYRLTTVTYGLACAPFLAIRTLRQLASDENSRFPLGARVLRRECYVDDIATGADTIQDAITLQSELRALCTAGGFSLRKWASNCEAALTGINPDHKLHRSQHSWKTEGHSTLGMRWYPSTDTFTFTIQPRTLTEFTKRRVLSETARLFDPLGWLAPVVMRAKILIQSAWLRQLDWDTPLPSADAHQWQRFLSELPSLDRIRVDRWLGTSSSEETHTELHGFADASERGYAAAIYLRVSRRAATTTRLIIAKSKVAPVKQVSLPRLELSAAVMVANLMQHVRANLDLFTAPVYLWSDSQVTLHWIQGHSSRWKTYVANRVSQIQELLPEARWQHVLGRDNPADCASRGSEECNKPLPEERIIAHAKLDEPQSESDILLRFSSLHQLLRVTAWCCRWQHIVAHKETTTTLQPEELEEALIRWLRMTQAIYYADEIAAVSANQAVSQRSHLKLLNPYIDDNGVLRVGGRLKNALLAYDERHPMIVPPNSWLTKLIVESCHLRTLHGGVQLTLGLLRLRFWVPRGRAIVKQLLHRCITCTRWRAVTPQPLMGNLPQERITPARPFLRTGLDYAGPISIRTSKGRGHKAHKGYIAVFVCFCTKAVHLEVVSDYSTESFLAAFRRFVSRRGLCTDIFSDCGTNFVGAARELRQMFRASSSDGRRIATTAARDGVKWHFNPPAAPHFGGLWEAAVKSTKHHLRRVIGKATLTFEEMSTFLAQVEACLNSRPLQSLSDDPTDISALTPGHFLTGAPLLAVPEPSRAERSDNTLTR